MASLIVSSSCPSELSNFSVLAASDEGQLAVATNDGVFVLVSCQSFYWTSWVELFRSFSLFHRGVGYMRICDRIFCQNTHIAYIFAYSGIFRILYAKIMPHMRKYAACRICKNLHIFAYMPHISAYAIAFFSIFLVQRCIKTAKYFGGKRLPVFTIRRWINWN